VEEAVPPAANWRHVHELKGVVICNASWQPSHERLL